MKAVEFCYWLQGYFEMGGSPESGMTQPQVDLVKAHLAIVFKHEIDGSYGNAEHQAALNKIHGMPPGSGHKPGEGVTFRC